MHQLLLTIFLLLQASCTLTFDETACVSPAHDRKMNVQQNFWWWPFRYGRQACMQESSLFHNDNDSAHIQDNIEPIPTVSTLQKIDCAQVCKMQNKIREYLEYDVTLSNLNDQCMSYVDRIQEYNTHLDQYENLPAHRKAIFEANYSKAKTDIALPQTTIDQIDTHINRQIASKNVNYRWQFQKYGVIQGSFIYMKNLFMPRSTYSYIGTGLASFGILSAFFKKPSQSSVIINAHEGAHLIVQNDRITQQDVLKTITLCSLVTGATIAARQTYLSWMYHDESKQKLAGWIDRLQKHNNSIQQYHTNYITQVKLANVEAGVQSVHNGLDNLTQTTTVHHQENQSQFTQVHHNAAQQYGIIRADLYSMQNQNEKTQALVTQLDEKVTIMQLGQESLQKSVDQLNILLRSLSIKYTVSQQQFCTWLGDEVKRRDEFDTLIMNKIDQNSWLQIHTYINSCKQLALAEKTAEHQGIKLIGDSSLQGYQHLKEAFPAKLTLPQNRLNHQSSYIPFQSFKTLKIFKSERALLPHELVIKDWKRYVLTVSESKKLALTESAKDAYATVIQQKWRMKKLTDKKANA